MPVINRIADFAQDMTGWRKHLHAHPELRFECYETAKFVVKMLREFGVDEIHEGIATTGIVAIINGRETGPTIGLRWNTLRPLREKCMLAGMTGIRRCFWGLRVISQKPAILQGARH
jgi:hypothetical protein